jgi:hypothetical protein
MDYSAMDNYHSEFHSLQTKCYDTTVGLGKIEMSVSLHYSLILYIYKYIDVTFGFIIQEVS